MSETTKEAATQVDIFNLAEIPVTVTYAGLGAKPITFYMRPWLVKDDQDTRQAFFALTDEEQEKGRAAHNVEMLARLSTRAPEGIPDFTGDIRAFFSDGNPMKEKVAADVINRYFRSTQPEEFFRSV